MSLSSLFWISSAIGAALYATFGSFKFICTEFLTATKFKNIKSTKEASSQASVITAIPNIFSVFGTPIVGILLDRIGLKGWGILVGAITSFISYILLDILDPTVAIVSLGFSFSIFGIATWAGISLTVNKTGQVNIIFNLKNLYLGCFLWNKKLHAKYWIYFFPYDCCSDFTKFKRLLYCNN